MRRFRKPKRFKEVSTFELAWQRASASQFWQIARTILIPIAILYSVWHLTWGNAERRDALISAAVSVQYSAEHLPQFMLSDVSITGLQAPLEQHVKDMLDISFPVSVFNLDREMIAEKLKSIQEIENYVVRPQGGGLLTINAVPSLPVAKWKRQESYELISASGRSLSRAFTWDGEDSLPLVSGNGADRVAYEIPSLMRVAEPLRDSMIGFVRVGERRWDIMMKNGLLIMLPQDGALAALQTVIEWEESDSITSRRVSRIDMRIPEHPLFRIIAEDETAIYEAFRLQNSKR